MKILISVLMFLFTVESFSQSKDTESTIRDLEEKEVNAILNTDTVALKKIWAPEFLVNNPRNTISMNRDAVLQVMKGGLVNYRRFERIIEQVQIQKDMVITMGHEIIVSRKDMQGVTADQPYKRRFTNIWMKKKGKWVQVGRHASIICE